MVNVTQRINARKIVLSYLYQHCFFCNLLKKDSIITESLFINYIFKTDDEKYDLAKKELLEQIKTYEYLNSLEEIKEFADIFFDQWTAEDIDMEYLFKITGGYEVYEAELIKQVNTHATSFVYDEMDTIDQAIFLLGYTERMIVQTPKEILLNEMIELAKRYSDDGAPRLINGIMHKIIATSGLEGIVEN